MEEKNIPKNPTREKINLKSQKNHNNKNQKKDDCIGSNYQRIQMNSSIGKLPVTSYQALVNQCAKKSAEEKNISLAGSTDSGDKPQNK